jgi:ribosome-associated heat shock protein Hsp15
LAGGRRTLRLDKFLYFTRFAKSRSKAQALIIGASPRINHRPVSTVHTHLVVGDTITLVINSHIRIIRIAALPLRRGPAAEAQACYSDLSRIEVIDADAL